MPQLLASRDLGSSDSVESDTVTTAADHFVISTHSLSTANSLADYQFSVTGAIRKQHATGKLLYIAYHNAIEAHV